MSRLTALSKAWRATPPVAVQLRTIATWLGIKAGRTPAAEARPSGEEMQMLESMPRAPLPEYLTPEQYLASKGTTHG